MRKKIYALALFPLMGLAQENPTDFHLSLELSTKYMWRGIEYGTSPVVFPSINYQHKGLNVFVMGAYAFDGSHQEVDYGLSYTRGWFTLGASDYYYPSEVGEKDNYFDYKSHSTGHSIETYLNVAPENFPMWLLFSTYIYGGDKKPDGSQAYSSYAELGYRYDLNEYNALSLAVGANLNKSFYTNYASGFNVVNIAMKYAVDVPIGKKFRLPLSASYVLNPYQKKSYFTFSLYYTY